MSLGALKAESWPAIPYQRFGELLESISQAPRQQAWKQPGSSLEAMSEAMSEATSEATSEAMSEAMSEATSEMTSAGRMRSETGEV